MAKLNPKFVEVIPDVLADGVLYISIAHSTAVHHCCCGCGREVVTPLTPTDWKLIFDGDTVSLYPSVGNWNFPCRSHYWITRSCIEWAQDWSDWQIAAAGVQDQKLKTRFYASREAEGAGEPTKEDKPRGGFWSKFWKDL